MGRIPDLPCDIEQVVDLLGIEVIRDTGTQLHCRCPFCADRKAHMNVKIRDNVFRCNRCGKRWGLSSIFMRSTVMSISIRLTKNSANIRADGGEPVRKCKRKPRSIETVELPIASLRYGIIRIPTFSHY